MAREAGDMKRLESVIAVYARKNGYPASHFATAVCEGCQGIKHQLLINPTEGVAARVCPHCDTEHGIGDSDDYLNDADEVYSVECACGSRTFNVVCGVSLYADSEDVRWFYLACRCTACDEAGVYADWKNEHIGYQSLLAKV